MQEFNPFLAVDRGLAKGGEWSIEDPATVENIVFQTRGEPLSDFESGLADALMAAFAAGSETLPDLVVALGRADSVDADGRAWTAESLAAQLSRSATLFQPVESAR